MRKLLLIGISTFALGAASALAYADAQSSSKAETYKMLELFGDVLTTVKRDYVVPVSDKKLIQAAIDGMLTSLDPHSGYLDPSSFSDMQDTTRGDYGGLGLVVSAEDGAVKVISPMDGTPAAKAGIQAGDYITAIDGASILGQPLNDAVKSMRGAVGTPISLTIARDKKDPFTVKLTREVIALHTVSHHAEGDVGYLRVSGFDEKTGQETAAAIKDLKAKIPHMKGLVLDLRNNPGGLVDAAVDVSSAFLDGGEVVSQRGRDPRDIQRYNAKPGGDLVRGVPMVVLINYGSASAAEIVAGALKDRGRATVVGLTSFGKGSVQTVLPLRGGADGAVKLTTAKYYTPSGASIQKTGITPELAVARSREEAQLINDQAVDFSEASYKNALDSQEGKKRSPLASIEVPPVSQDPSAKEGEDKKKVKLRGPDSVIVPGEQDNPADDFQLRRAIDVLHYGGVQQTIAAHPADLFKKPQPTFALNTAPASPAAAEAAKAPAAKAAPPEKVQ
jgi:carboxyl-terminal processing protease